MEAFSASSNGILEVNCTHFGNPRTGRQDGDFRSWTTPAQMPPMKTIATIKARQVALSAVPELTGDRDERSQSTRTNRSVGPGTDQQMVASHRFHAVLTGRSSVAPHCRCGEFCRSGDAIRKHATAGAKILSDTHRCSAHVAGGGARGGNKHPSADQLINSLITSNQFRSTLKIELLPRGDAYMAARRCRGVRRPCVAGERCVKVFGGGNR